MGREGGQNGWEYPEWRLLFKYDRATITAWFRMKGSEHMDENACNGIVYGYHKLKFPYELNAIRR